MNMPAPASDTPDAEFQLSLIRAIHDASPGGILVVDDRGVVVSHNRSFVEIMRIPHDRLQGAQPATAIGQHDDRILAAALDAVKDSQAVLARVHELYANPQLDDHCELEMKDGRTVERHSTGLRGRDGKYLGRVWFFHDVTRQKQTEAALQALARHDPLTGIANRRYFFEQANQEFARARRHRTPLCITEIDIDHFKSVNDCRGHAGGDAVLKSFCGVAQCLIRETELFAQRLRKATADATLKLDGGGEVRCTVSLGVATLHDDDAAVEDCLRRADAALYRAKQHGRNRVEVEA